MVATSNKYPETYSRWMDGLLAGNGKQGAIIFGNPLDETVIYTDRDFFMARTESQPHRKFADVAQTDIDYIRDQLIANNYRAANERARDVQGYSGGGEGSKHPGYKMMMKTNESGAVTDYMRATDYQNGIVYVNWKDGRGEWERETFVSRDEDVTVQYQEAPADQEFDMSLELAVDSGMHLGKVEKIGNVDTVTEPFEEENNSDTEFLNLRLKYHGNRYEAGYEGVTKVITDGDKSMDGDTLKIEGATKVLLLTKTQRYNGFYDGQNNEGNPAEVEWAKEELQAKLNTLATTVDDYASLKNDHTEKHSEIMSRVTLAFGASAEDRSKTNEDLIAMQKASATMVPAMYERLFYAGRYHTLGSSYEKAAPDLLGNWTGDSQVGWDGYYHLDANLNLQIAGANIGNMPEVMKGYTWLNSQWKKDFQTNAIKLLKTRGMLVGGNTPNGEGLISNINFDYPYQYVTGGMGWLLYPIWEQYLITGDENILRDDYYPLVKEMGEFYEDFLVKKDENGKYIFAGSISPETRPNGGVPLTVNSVYDISGAKFALETLLRTVDILGVTVDDIVKAKWQDRLDNLPPYIINDAGALSGWAWPDLANKDDYAHRHSSGLMPIWPYQEVTAENAPDYHEAAKVFLSKKDGGSYENAGHGLLHGAMIAAKLNEDQSVRAKLLRFVKDNYYYNSLGTAHYNTVTPGVFCTDVANSVPTVMMEMLASTTEDTIELLPALPKDLTKGSIKGMLGRSGITIDDLTWDMTTQTISVTLTSKTTQELTLIQRDGIEEITSNKGADIITNLDASKIARKISLEANEATTFELKVKDVSKVNLALDKPATAGSESGSDTKENAFDGDTATRWGASQNDAENWIYVDLEDTYAINEVVLRWEDAYAKKYEIQMSKDGENWKTVHTENTSDGGVDVITLDNVTGRYIRMQGLEKSGTWGASLWEMEVYGGPLPNIALNKPAEAYSQSGSNTKEKAFDGDDGTRWGANQNHNDWIYVDLEDTYEIDTVVLKWEDAYAKKYKIQVSMDKTQWNDVHVQDDSNGGVETIPLTNAIGRYVRMQSVQMAGQWGVSLWEMEVYGEKSGGTSEPDPEDPSDPDPEGIEGENIYVSQAVSTSGDGSEGSPFKTINEAAQVAGKGSTVIVDAGVYRETVKPAYSGTAEKRITYKAKEGAEVTIKGSEEITTWEDDGDNVWKVVLPNTYFGSYNPYNTSHPLGGDGQTFAGFTCGDVYLNSEAYRQKATLDAVKGAKAKATWYATVDGSETTIYANFGNADPNDTDELAEINVRQQVFAPDAWGLGYITVDGFTIMHAANGYSDFPDQPTRRQAGAISVYGGLEWIIENNTIINARTIGIDIGLSCDMWAGNRPGETKTNFRETDKYGSHIVRNNYIAKCGQSGIAGVFSWNSQIINNRIEKNNYRGEFSGAETAPIKVHYMNYGLIKGNYINGSQGGNSAGIWTDWGNQGVRVTGNIVIDCPWGYYAEAMHGPALVDNNVFIGNSNIRTLDATGIVFVNNLFYNNGNFAVDGNGRNCFYFEPSTMNETEIMSGPVQKLFWMNNLVQGSTLPNNRDQITHVKEGNSVGTISNFTYEAGDEMSIKFDLAGGVAKGSIVTKDRIDTIPNANEKIAADVDADYFGNAFDNSSLLVGPFADIKAGLNEIKLWPIGDQENTPLPPAEAEEKPVNLSLRDTTTVTASHEDLRPNEDRKAIYAIDGDEGTRWSSNGAEPQNTAPADITIDLGELCNVKHVVLKWEGAYASEYKLQVSEDSREWKDVLHETNGDGGEDQITVNEKTRYVRMSGITPQTSYGFSLYEFEVYGTTIPLENLALNKPSEAMSSSNASQTSDKAFDGNNGTRWAASQNPANWLQVDLQDFYEIRQINIFWEDSYAKGYRLEVSNDKENWTIIHTETNNQGAMEEIAITPTVARYVRMQCTAMSGQWGISIWEMGIYGVPVEAPDSVRVKEISDVSTDKDTVEIDYSIIGTAQPDAYYNIILGGYDKAGQLVSYSEATGDSIDIKEGTITMPNTGNIAEKAFMVWEDITQAPLTGGVKINAKGEVQTTKLPAVIGAVGTPEVTIVEANEASKTVTITGSGFAANGMVTILSTLDNQTDYVGQVIADNNGEFTHTYKSDFSLDFGTSSTPQATLKVSVGGQGLATPATATQSVAVTVAMDPRVSTVINWIDSIGTPVTLDSLEAIITAETYYNALVLLSLNLELEVTNHGDLVAARAAYDNLKADRDAATVVVVMINDIGEVSLAQTSKDAIEAARVAYEALTNARKELVDNIADLEAAETRYDELVAEKAVVDAVIGLIDDIGFVELTDESLAAINAAVDAYESLTQAQKAKVTNVTNLMVAQLVYKSLEEESDTVALVTEKINAIGEVTEATLVEEKAKIDEARAAYDALKADLKAKVAPADKAKLEAAEASYATVAVAKGNADQAAATDVQDKITDIGEVVLTDECQTKIANAKAAYDALSDDQKQLVTNHAVLLVAELAYESKAKEKELTNKIAASVVEVLIDGIGTVEMTEGSKTKIDYAKAAYDNLSAEQQALISGAKKDALADAQTAYQELVDGFNQKAIDTVIERINNIGTVNTSANSKKKIDDAQAAYNALTDTQKALVTNLQALQTANTKYQTLVKEEAEAKAAADKAAADKAAADKAAADKAAADKAAADKKVADAVIAKINGIGKVDASAASKKKIDEAQAAYNALSADQKKLVTNANVLNTAQAEYTKQTAPSKKGSTFTVGNFKYKVVKAATATSQGTVQIIGTTKKNITSINIKKTVKSGLYTYKITSIGNKAFRNLKKLKKVTIGDNVTTIGNDAFSGCVKLTKVTIGKGVTKIGSKAFYNCKKLKSIVIKSTKIKSVGKNAFKGIHNKAKIKVPKSKVKSYIKLFKGKGQKNTVKIAK